MTPIMSPSMFLPISFFSQRFSNLAGFVLSTGESYKYFFFRNAMVAHSSLNSKVEGVEVLVVAASVYSRRLRIELLCCLS